MLCSGMLSGLRFLLMIAALVLTLACLRSASACEDDILVIEKWVKEFEEAFSPEDWLRISTSPTNFPAPPISIGRVCAPAEPEGAVP